MANLPIDSTKQIPMSSERFVCLSVRSFPIESPGTVTDLVDFNVDLFSGILLVEPLLGALDLFC